MQYTERYGWLLLAAFIIIYMLWTRVVRPAFVDAAKRRQLAVDKKFGMWSLYLFVKYIV